MKITNTKSQETIEESDSSSIIDVIKETPSASESDAGIVKESSFSESDGELIKADLSSEVENIKDSSLYSENHITDFTSDSSEKETTLKEAVSSSESYSIENTTVTSSDTESIHIQDTTMSSATESVSIQDSTLSEVEGNNVKRQGSADSEGDQVTICDSTLSDTDAKEMPEAMKR